MSNIPFVQVSASRHKGLLIAVLGGLAFVNVGAWLWTLVAFQDKPSLLGVAVIVYGLGWRHAMDADHIVAIDNATRKLVEDKKRPVSVGLFFALGHSAIILGGSALIAYSAGLVSVYERLNGIGEVVGTGASALFLFAIAAANIAILTKTYSNYRRLTMAGRPSRFALTIPKGSRRDCSGRFFDLS